MIDPISDLMTRIRNAGLANHESTRAPYSKMRAKLLEIFRDEGYIEGFDLDEVDGIHKELIIHLKYIGNNELAVRKMRKVSKPGCRVYCAVKDIPKVNSGLGVVIVSTSKGIVTDREARRLNVGGEIICEIW